MASNGPYSVEAFGKSGYFVKGPFAHGAIVSVVDYVAATEMAFICNMAHAEGRKAAEKDFRVLLEFTNCAAQMLKEIWAVYVPSHDPSFLVGFNAWKKARGI